MDAFLSRLFWPLIIIYSLYFIYLIIKYFTDKKNWSNPVYYNKMFLKKFLITGLLIGFSIGLKFYGSESNSLIFAFAPVVYLSFFIILAIVVYIIYVMVLKRKKKSAKE